MTPNESAVVYYPAPEKPLTSAELRDVIGHALDANPKLAMALRQLFAERLARQTVDVAHPKATSDERSYCAGGLAELMAIQGWIAGAVSAAGEVRAKEAGKRRATK